MPITITVLEKKYPCAAYYTPRMIADMVGVTPQNVCKHCRRMFAYWRGQHWKFNTTDDNNDWLLPKNDLEDLIEYLAQLHERRIFFKK